MLSLDTSSVLIFLFSYNCSSYLIIPHHILSDTFSLCDKFRTISVSKYHRCCVYLHRFQLSNILRNGRSIPGKSHRIHKFAILTNYTSLHMSLLVQQVLMLVFIISSYTMILQVWFAIYCCHITSMSSHALFAVPHFGSRILFGSRNYNQREEWR